MPVAKKWNSGSLPAWSKIKKYEMITMYEDDVVKIENPWPKLIIWTGYSKLILIENGEEKLLLQNTVYETEIRELELRYKPRFFCEKNEIVLVYGDWQKAAPANFLVHECVDKLPCNRGTQDALLTYRNTNFDNHYHDFDEYWLILEGRGVAFSEGQFYSVGPGDLVLTQAGVNHDFPIVHTPISALAVEVGPVESERKGHLWEWRDGVAKEHQK